MIQKLFWILMGGYISIMVLLELHAQNLYFGFHVSGIEFILSVIVVIVGTWLGSKYKEEGSILVYQDKYRAMTLIGNLLIFSTLTSVPALFYLMSDTDSRFVASIALVGQITIAFWWVTIFVKTVRRRRKEADA